MAAVTRMKKHKIDVVPLLENAYARIKKKWAKGHYYNAPTGSVCLLGGVGVGATPVPSTGEIDEKRAAHDNYRTPEGRAMLEAIAAASPEKFEEFDAIYSSGYEQFYEWNDKTGRRKREVLQVIEKAIEARKENPIIEAADGHRP